MRKTMALLALTAGLGAFQTTARADAGGFNGFADFTLNPITGLDDGTAGQWLTRNVFFTNETAYRGVYDFPAQREAFADSSKLDPSVSAGNPFGHYDHSLPPLDGRPTLSTQVHVGESNLHASWRRGDLTDFGAASIQWQRAFTLNANSSITLSGLATLDVMGPPPTPTSTYEDRPNLSYDIGHEASLRHEADWFNGITLVGQILNYDPSDPQRPTLPPFPASAGDFEYSADSFGHLSLTMHNHTDQAIFGSFAMFLYTAAPVPEPATVGMMALGLLGLAWRARRRVG